MSSDDADKLLKDVVLYVRTGKVPQLLACLESYTGDLNFRWGDYTLLGHAASTGKEAAIQALIEKGARVSDVGSWGRTPLMLAAFKGSLESVRILVEAGADPETKDFDARTAVDYAREGRHPEVVAFLKGVAVDPWSLADKDCLASLDAELVAAATAYGQRAIASGERGEIQPLRPDSRFPEWYQRLLAALPLAGISFVASPPGQTWQEEGRFLSHEELETFVSEVPHCFEPIVDRGLCPIADGSDGNHWAIEREGDHRSPVHLWNQSDMKPVPAYGSFTEFLAAARQWRSR